MVWDEQYHLPMAEKITFGSVTASLTTARQNFRMSIEEARRKCNCPSRKIFACFFFLCAGLYLNVGLFVTIWNRQSNELHDDNSLSLMHSLAKKMFSFKGYSQIHHKNRNFSLIMQYKVSPNDSAYVPDEVKGGHPLLLTRTYPKTPRKEKCNKCFEYVYDTVIRPKTCDAGGDIDLLILITTIPSARAERDAIRQTWLSLTEDNKNSVRYMWLFGSGWPAEQQAALEEESKHYGDIIQDDYIDSYFNLSIKVMGGFKFALENCKNAKYILRTAEDNFLNIPNILGLLERLKDELEDYIFGSCNKGPMPIRNKASKWAVTVNEWGNHAYPEYPVGTAFGMTFQTMKKLYTASENVPYFVIEDVFFGEVCRQIGIKMKCFAGFLHPVPTIKANIKNPCPLCKSCFAFHDVKTEDQLLIWKYCQKN